MIVQSSAPITLVGGAKVRPTTMNAALIHAPKVVAVDGGADAVLAQGLMPEAVIGDMDSLSEKARAAFADRLHEVREQDSTDFDKALRHVRAPLVLAVGASGGRFDHELAVMHVLLAYPERFCVVLGDESLVFLCPPEISLDLSPSSVVSLFPFAPCRVRSDGLRWATDHLVFDPVHKIGTSNEAMGPIRLRADKPVMMVVLPTEALAAVVTALGSLPDGGQWPALAR